MVPVPRHHHITTSPHHHITSSPHHHITTLPKPTSKRQRHKRPKPVHHRCVWRRAGEAAVQTQGGGVSIGQGCAGFSGGRWFRRLRQNWYARFVSVLPLIKTIRTGTCMQAVATISGRCPPRLSVWSPHTLPRTLPYGRSARTNNHGADASEKSTCAHNSMCMHAGMCVVFQRQNKVSQLQATVTAVETSKTSTISFPVRFHFFLLFSRVPM